MKKIVAILSFLILLSASLPGAEKEYVFTDAKTLSLFGKITPDTEVTYSRLAPYLKEKTRKPVWDLGLNSAGLYIRFRSDAGEMRAKWKVSQKGCGDNMSKILKNGMALYVFDKGEWVFVSSFRPRGGKEDETQNEYTISFSKLKGSMHEFMVYLPMYNNVQSLEFGVPAGCSIVGPEMNSPRAEKPVIAYGTSILQGASASHPGLASTNVLTRKIDRQVINLGFSGNGRLDMEIAEYMASYPNPGAFVLDNAPNCSAELMLEKQEAFFRILRNAHPDVPVIFVEMPLYPRVRFDEKGAENTIGRRDAMDQVYNKLKKAGEKNIYLVKSDKMLLEDNVGTIEGTHFTDIAFERWAEVLSKVLRKVCK